MARLDARFARGRAPGLACREHHEVAAEEIERRSAVQLDMRRARPGPPRRLVRVLVEQPVVVALGDDRRRPVPMAELDRWIGNERPDAASKKRLKSVDSTIEKGKK